MADINFKTSSLANAYLHGVGLAIDPGGWLLDFRTRGSTTIQNDIASLDQRIANFQNVITDGTAKTGVDAQDFPYDKESLKREFMNEVYANLLKRGYGQVVYAFAGALSGPIPIFPVGSDGLLAGGPFYEAVQTGTGPLGIPIYSQGQLVWDGTNFDNMTVAQQRNILGQDGKGIYDAYSTWIDAVFSEGNKMKTNPVDAATGATIVTKVTTAIPEREINGVVYDRVTFDGTKYYLISADAQTYTAAKVNVNGTRAYYDPNAPDPNHSDRIAAGGVADTYIGFTTNTLASSRYLEVTKDLVPVSGGLNGSFAQRNLSPSMYLYFWIEARIRVLRGQLNYKEAVTAEIRDDLAKANSAYADLEAQAGKTRAQSPDGKTTDPDLSSETQNMDFFEATNAKQGTVIYNNNGGDDQHRFSEWGASRSALKSYIDRKSTQSQDAMLDYQTTLNRFNQAYEVMSKIQEKMDGLVKGQLRNV